MHNDTLDSTDIWWAELEAMWGAGKRCSSDFVIGTPPRYSPKEVNDFVEAAFAFPTIHEIFKRRFPHADEKDTSEWYRGDPKKVERFRGYNEASITSFFGQWFVLKYDLGKSPYAFDGLIFCLRRVLNAAPEIDLPSAIEAVSEKLREKKWLK